MNGKEQEKISQSKSIIDVLNTRSTINPNKTIFSYYHFSRDDRISEENLTYEELSSKAKRVAFVLKKCGVTQEPVVLLYPPGLDYIIAFMGCLYKGVKAVPAYPPMSTLMFRRFMSIVVDCKAKYILTTQQIIPAIKSQLEGESTNAELNCIATDNLGDELGMDAINIDDEDEIAFIQYTSGSTSAPKGVCLTHGNLLDNSRAIHHFFDTSEDSRGVFWLPLYHDMGLIGGILQTIYCGGSSIFFSPLDFLRKPVRWLQVISQSKATISGGPNFAYDLCARKATSEQLEEMNLESWRLAFNGAEPIRHETFTRFYDVFKKNGFRYEAFYPCYGLAESTLIVSGGLVKNPPRSRAFDRSALKTNQTVQEKTDNNNISKLVSCGKPLDCNRIVIVNPDNRTKCQPNEVGEIWVQSLSVARCYIYKPEDTKNILQAYTEGEIDGPFLRTGDLGFLYEGELYITSRLKDLIVIHGKNYYPNDIEESVEKCNDAFRKGCSAAFSIDHRSEEKLVVVQEIKRDYLDIDTERFREAVCNAVLIDFQLQVYDVVLIKPGTIPKTSSGKIQRHECKRYYLNSELERYDDVGHKQLAHIQQILK